MREEGPLVSAFRALSQPAGQPGQLAGARLEAAGNLYLCKDGNGRPGFLLPISSVLPPIKLENLEVKHRVRCKVLANGRTIPIPSATLICCLSEDKRLHDYFVQALGGVLSTHPGVADPAALGPMLEALSELFQAVSAEPASSAQGLWAELALVDAAVDPALVIGAWHSEVDDLYDFSFGTERIEVKSSSDKTRCHHFRLEQVDSPACVRVLVASMLVDRAGRGVSVAQLWERCRQKVAAKPELQVKVDALCFRALGRHWHRWSQTSYDYERARRSLAFFDARLVPKPPTPMTTGVSEVRFVADLSGVETADITAAKYRGPLVTALGPIHLRESSG